VYAYRAEGEREWGAAAEQVMSSAPSAVQGSWRPCLSNWGRVGLPVGASDLPSPEAEPGTEQFLAVVLHRRGSRGITGSGFVVASTLRYGLRLPLPRL
jgi:hypothetical protein